MRNYDQSLKKNFAPRFSTAGTSTPRSQRSSRIDAEAIKRANREIAQRWANGEREMDMNDLDKAAEQSMRTGISSAFGGLRFENDSLQSRDLGPMDFLGDSGAFGMPSMQMAPVPGLPELQMQTPRLESGSAVHASALRTLNVDNPAQREESVRDPTPGLTDDIGSSSEAYIEDEPWNGMAKVPEVYDVWERQALNEQCTENPTYWNNREPDVSCEHDNSKKCDVVGEWYNHSCDECHEMQIMNFLGPREDGMFPLPYSLVGY